MLSNVVFFSEEEEKMVSPNLKKLGNPKNILLETISV
jgi:hypothetical protein